VVPVEGFENGPCKVYLFQHLHIRGKTIAGAHRKISLNAYLLIESLCWDVIDLGRI